MLPMANWMHDCKPTRYTGIFKTEKGYRVRLRMVDPRSGRQKEVNREFEQITIDDALAEQVRLRERLREPEEGKGHVRVRYGDYVESLLRRKIAKNELASAKSRRTWVDVQAHHLVPYFGNYFVDALRRSDVNDWLDGQGRRVKRGRLSPHSVNGWLRILLNTLRTAVDDFELGYDPTRGVTPLDTSTWETYTEEEPNALVVAEVPVFMATLRRLYPQHFAMIALGLATGRRPCELRPLRRRGPKADVLWEEGVLLVRRSETLGVALDRTKTGARLRIPLPPELINILRWHVERLPEGPMVESELLFPSLSGGFRPSTVLWKPIEATAKAAGIKKHLSPRFMRRTFQDMGRVANVPDLVVRSISGHATAEMQELYSSVGDDEKRQGLGRVIQLFGLGNDERDAGVRVGSGDRSGYQEGEARRAG